MALRRRIERPLGSSHVEGEQAAGDKDAGAENIAAGQIFRHGPIFTPNPGEIQPASAARRVAIRPRNSLIAMPKLAMPLSGSLPAAPSLSGAESVGITRLLMSLDDPSPEVDRAVDGAVAWFEAAKLPGIKVVEVEDKAAAKGKDKRVVADPAAQPMWARFYEIGTNRPIFADRDGVAKHELSEIGYERRNGYAWLGTWPARLLEVEYPAWKKRVAK